MEKSVFPTWWIWECMDVVGLLQRSLAEKEPPAWPGDTQLGYPKTYLNVQYPWQTCVLIFARYFSFCSSEEWRMPVLKNYLVSRLSNSSLQTRSLTKSEDSNGWERDFHVFQERQRGHSFSGSYKQYILFFTFFSEEFKNRINFWSQYFWFQNWYSKKVLRNPIYWYVNQIALTFTVVWVY